MKSLPDVADPHPACMLAIQQYQYQPKK